MVSEKLLCRLCRNRGPTKLNGSVKLAGVGCLFRKIVVILINNLIDCGSDSPTMPCGDAFQEYGLMIGFVRKGCCDRVGAAI